METLKIDCGLREYRVNGKGILRLNPTDPNVYTRFEEMMETLPNMADQVESVKELDQQLKAALSRVFPNNDFDKLLGGVSLLAICANGQKVLDNLLEALAAVMEQGMEEYAQLLAQQVRDR